VEFPYQDNDEPRTGGKRRMVLAACTGTALLVILLWFSWRAVWTTLEDWGRGRTRDADGVTYSSRVPPEPVVFEVKGIRIGDPLEKVKPLIDIFPEQVGKTTGMLGYSDVDFDVRYFFFFDDGKLISICLNFPIDYFDGIVAAYDKKLGLHYKTRFEDKPINQIASWRTTDGDFNVKRLNSDETKGFGELCYDRWKLAEFDKDLKEWAKKRDRIQSDLNGKL
jgi:hypothetical protein